MKTYVKSIAVLASICLVLAALLGLVNMLTQPVIEDAENRKVQAALAEVLPDTAFEKLSFVDYEGTVEFPSSVLEAYSADNGGFVFKLDVKGYSTGLVLLVGVNAEGRVSGSKVISSNETNGAENGYGDNLVGKTSDTVNSVATVSGSTLTTTAYKNAVKTALDLAAALKPLITVKGANG